MAVLRDKEEEKGQGTSQALGQQVPGQAQPQEQTQPQQPQTSSPATIGGSSATQTSAPVKAMPKQQKAGTGTFANLRTYLQAAQGGGQQRVAQAATQQVQRLGTGAQKGVQQAQEAFGRQMQAGSLQGMETAAEEAKNIIGTARQATYQAPQATPAVTPQAEGTPAQPQPQAPAQPQQYSTPEQQQRFAEIINAQYQGPASIQQAGLYEQAAKKARTAQQAAELTQTAGGREQLLRDVFGRGRDYSRGASRLDALLLNASEQGVQQLQQQAQPALQAQQALQAAQNLSANEAAQRAAAIQGIRSGARTAFTEARAAEEQAVDQRLSQVVENWNQLPDYFKQILRDKEKGALALSEQEAGLLGVQAGEGLYNLTPEELIQTSAAEKERLITKNELSRQLALQQLAGTDLSRELQKDLLYTDLEKAGTQTAEDAINKQAIRELLNAQEKAFREQAAGQTLVGEGSKKHKSSGKRYYAQETANLKDLLEKAGYDFTSDIGAGARGKVETDKDAPEMNRDILQPNLGAVTDPYTSNQSEVAKAAYFTGDAATLGATAGLRGLTGVDPVGAVTGALGLSGPSSRYAKNIAARGAREDLQRKVTQALEQAGFANRTAVGETEATKARQAALQEILAARERLRG